MEGGTGIKVLWYRELNTTNTALRKAIRPKPASNEMFAPCGNPVKTACCNGTKRPKTLPSETTPYRDHLSTIITLREWGNMRESGRGSLTRVPTVVSETPHSPGKYQQSSSLVSKVA